MAKKKEPPKQVRKRKHKPKPQASFVEHYIGDADKVPPTAREFVVAHITLLKYFVCRQRCDIADLTTAAYMQLTCSLLAVLTDAAAPGERVEGLHFCERTDRLGTAQHSSCIAVAAVARELQRDAVSAAVTAPPPPPLAHS